MLKLPFFYRAKHSRGPVLPGQPTETYYLLLIYSPKTWNDQTGLHSSLQQQF